MNVHHECLRNLVSTTLEKAGCTASDAQSIARHLVESNLTGHDSHGVIRLPKYLEFLRDGVFKSGLDLEIVFENDIMAIVDGQFVFGQVVAERVMRLALDKADHHGMAIVALRRSGHVGRVGHFAEMAAAEGKISIHFVGTSGRGLLVAPHGGTERRLSANPIAVGVPVEGRPPIIVDISTSVVAEGKIQVALNKGTQLKDNSILDSDGNPTTDPKRFYTDPPGVILPFAEHKGYCLSFVCEMLAGALTGNQCTRPGVTQVSQGMLTIVLDPTRFGPKDAFQAEILQFIEYVKSSKTVTSDGEILVPGEPEARTRAERSANGIELDETTWSQLFEACETAGLTQSEIDGLIKN